MIGGVAIGQGQSLPHSSLFCMHTKIGRTSWADPTPLIKLELLSLVVGVAGGDRYPITFSNSVRTDRRHAEMTIA